MKICKIGRRGLPLQCKGVMLIGAKLPLARTMCAILGVVCLLLTGCYAETYDAEETSTLKGKSQVVLSFVTPNNSSTRSATDDPDGYEDGIGYEDDINISGHDYKIYFFTYDSSNRDAGTLIAEFKPTDITQSSTSSATTYTVIGDVPNELLDVSDFRVVMLANYGLWYPSVTVGTTTIDDLVEGENTTFNAFKKFTIDQDNLIPFYGVQEYTGITFTKGSTTNLTTPVSLLRAVAKVEMILTADSDVESFDDVSIVNYNSQGYCAPAGVYTADDYDTEMKNGPSSGNWVDEWVNELHLVNGKNDTGTKTQVFTQISDASLDTWRIYLPEYDNVSRTSDYSYITVNIGDTPYNIYFAEYIDGLTDNTDRYNLKRNNLYRFYVTVLLDESHDVELRVWVETWENVFDNEWTLGGEYSRLIYSDSDPNNFTADDGYIYASLVEEDDEVSEANPTVYLQKVSMTTSGYVIIPETVTYLGYTYTVVGIGSYCFEADQDVTFITIPATVTYIESDAFHGDTGLQGIAIHSETPPDCAEDAFEGDDLTKITLYVPEGSLSAYQVADVWKEFTNITEVNFSGN